MSNVTNLDVALGKGTAVRILDREIVFRRPKLFEVPLVTNECAEVFIRATSMESQDPKAIFGAIGTIVEKITAIIPYFTNLDADEAKNLDVDYLEPLCEEVYARNKDFFQRLLSRWTEGLSGKQTGAKHSKS